MVQRLGLFGGSFDPIHRGHIEPVREAQGALGLDRVFFLPTAHPPHKPDRRMASAWRRFAMVELALLDDPSLQTHAHELTLGRTAYTIETLEAFSDSLPGVELCLMIGEDSLRALPTWRRGLEIPGLATVAVMRRPRAAGLDGAQEEPEPIESAVPEELEQAYAEGRIVLLETLPVPHSSTAIRRALADRCKVDDPALAGLEPRVLDYILKYELY